MQTKEKWIDETMDALDGITRAESNLFLHDKVLQRIHQNHSEIVRIRTSLIWKLAACLAILISINLFTLIHNYRSATTDQNTVKSVAAEYFSYIDSYNL